MVVGIDGDPPLRMELVSNLADINVGDLIVTSGVDGVYPKGFTIGKVEKSERGNKLYRTITVRPAVDFSSLEEVLVVLVPARGVTPDKPGAPATGRHRVRSRNENRGYSAGARRRAGAFRRRSRD